MRWRGISLPKVSSNWKNFTACSEWVGGFHMYGVLYLEWSLDYVLCAHAYLQNSALCIRYHLHKRTGSHLTNQLSFEFLCYWSCDWAGPAHRQGNLSLLPSMLWCMCVWLHSATCVSAYDHAHWCHAHQHTHMMHNTTLYWCTEQSWFTFSFHTMSCLFTTALRDLFFFSLGVFSPGAW